MLEQWFSSVLPATVTGSAFPILPYLLCTLCSLALGGVIAAGHTFRNTYSKSFVTTLALLPAIVQMVILLVNGNLGTGVAVMGAFSLIRFRSVPGTAREIGSIFLSMAVGLATGNRLSGSGGPLYPDPGTGVAAVRPYPVRRRETGGAGAEDHHSGESGLFHGI